VLEPYRLRAADALLALKEGDAGSTAANVAAFLDLPRTGSGAASGKAKAKAATARAASPAHAPAHDASAAQAHNSGGQDQGHPAAAEGWFFGGGCGPRDLLAAALEQGAAEDPPYFHRRPPAAPGGAARWKNSGAAAAEAATRITEPPPRESLRDMQKVFKLIDSSGDGVISRDEWRFALEAR